MRQPRSRLGEAAEKRAARFLMEQGYEILEANYRWRRGEIDLIARDGDSIVFVEVKCKSSRKFGSPEEAVGREKRAQLQRGALTYLQESGLVDLVPVRFDVVALRCLGDRWTIDHIQNAFGDVPRF